MDRLQTLPSARPLRGASTSGAVAEAKQAARTETKPSGVSFRDVLESTMDSVDSGTNAMNRAVRGAGNLDNQQLLQLQAKVYRYTETVDLVAKVTERTTSAAKTVLQSQ